jgi:hypothetical protein
MEERDCIMNIGTDQGNPGREIHDEYAYFYKIS